MLYNGINPLKLRATRFAGLKYANTNPAGKPLWRFVDCHDEGRQAAVGPHYASQAELLADADRYARDAWGYK